MKKIFETDKDLIITYSWSSVNHGICGHTFEAIDYYLLLSQYFDVGLLFAEDISWEDIKILLDDRYQLTKDEIENLKKNTIFQNRPSLYKVKNILFVDGGINMINQYVLLCNNIFMFACGQEIKNTQEKYIILQDFRIYPEIPKSIDYKKKLFFGKYKPKWFYEKGDKTLIYATENCRKTDKELPNQLKLTKEDLPYPNLFDEFDTYYYTPVPRKFDCSSRLLAECKFYNKKVIFDKEVKEYFEEDKGLYWRWHDIQNDFESLFLTYDDDIIKIIKDICEL
jgi:hypothetical protein